MVYSPFCDRRLFAFLHNPAVKFTSVFLLDGSDVTFPLIRGNGRKLGHAEIVDSVVGDMGRDSLLKSCGTRYEISPEADPHKGDLFQINARQSEREINNQGDNLLPIRTKRQALAMNRPVLAWAVEGQHIPATLDSSPCAFAVHLFC